LARTAPEKQSSENDPGKIKVRATSKVCAEEWRVRGLIIFLTEKIGSEGHYITFSSSVFKCFRSRCSPLRAKKKTKQDPKQQGFDTTNGGK
jgi:hypothetical protein